MKKLLIFLIGGLLLPLTVYADMGVPLNLQYEVEVSNPNGISLYDMSCDKASCKLVKTAIVVQKDTILKIEYEEKINNELYGIVHFNNHRGYIKISDITIIDKEIDLNDEFVEKLDKPIEKTILSEKIEIHSSPAKAFKVIGTIKKGEKVKATHYYGYDGENDSWYHIEYKDIKGWIECYNGAVGEYIPKKIIILKEEELYSATDGFFTYLSGEETKKGIATIPANTIIDGYYKLDNWARSYYVEYEGKEGYIFKDETANKNNYKFKLFHDVKAFKNHKDAYNCALSNECLDHVIIPKDTELQAFWNYDPKGRISLYQVEYNDKLYWISDYKHSNLDLSFFEIYSAAIIQNKKITTTEEIKMYNVPESYYSDKDEDKLIATIAKDEEITIIYSIDSIHYIETKDGQKGWIEYDLDYKKTSEEPNEEPSEEQEPEEIEITERSLSKEELLYICIGGGIVLSLTAVVVIILISKKRNSKNKQKE